MRDKTRDSTRDRRTFSFGFFLRRKERLLILQEMPSPLVGSFIEFGSARNSSHSSLSLYNMLLRRTFSILLRDCYFSVSFQGRGTSGLRDTLLLFATSILLPPMSSKLVKERGVPYLGFHSKRIFFSQDFSFSSFSERTAKF